MVILFISMITGYVAMIAVQSLKSRDPRELHYVASINLSLGSLFCIHYIVGLISASYSLASAPAGATDLDSFDIKKIVECSLGIPFAILIFVSMTSTIKSLACVWEIGGTGREHHNWNGVYESKSFKGGAEAMTRRARKNAKKSLGLFSGNEFLSPESPPLEIKSTMPSVSPRMMSLTDEDEYM
eukprot:GHVH01003596.1.p1 GENE.GHVH01003596.1~~GHVH01003596.1.p1  ORF type:complete len:184 (+),score=25.81 GHVH01003596.1:535-1086(+)